MSFRSYTFLAPPPTRKVSRQRNLSFNEEEFAEQSNRIKTESINCHWACDSLPTYDAMSSQELIISPGNILDVSNTWRKGNETASEELFESLRSCLESKSKQELEAGGDASNVSDAEVIHVGPGSRISGVEGAERSDLKITGKIFLYSYDSDDIAAAIQKGLQESGTELLDSLVVSFCSDSEQAVEFEVVQQVWQVLEEAVASKSVNMIGLCDLDPQLFIKVYDWATIKPGIVQINLASCCVVPPELAAFTKQHDILLLTHSDPGNILPKDKLESLTDVWQARRGASWETKWVLRYQVHVKTRGVLDTKGYVASFKQNRR